MAHKSTTNRACRFNNLAMNINGCVWLHQIPAIPESVSQSEPFDYIILELEWPEFNSADSGLEAEF